MPSASVFHSSAREVGHDACSHQPPSVALAGIGMAAGAKLEKLELAQVLRTLCFPRASSEATLPPPLRRAPPLSGARSRRLLTLPPPLPRLALCRCLSRCFSDFESSLLQALRMLISSSCSQECWRAYVKMRRQKEQHVRYPQTWLISVSQFGAIEKPVSGDTLTLHGGHCGQGQSRLAKESRRSSSATPPADRLPSRFSVAAAPVAAATSDPPVFQP